MIGGMEITRRLDAFTGERGYRVLFWNSGVCPWCGDPGEIHLVQRLDPHEHDAMQPRRCERCIREWLEENPVSAPHS